MISIIKQREIVKQHQKTLTEMGGMLAAATIGRLYYAYYPGGKLACIGELKSIDTSSDHPFKFVGATGGTWGIIKPYVPINNI